MTNDGNVDLTGVSVKDSLITLTGPAGDDVDPGVLNVGETWTYTGIYTVTQEDISTYGGGDGFIENTATVSSNELPDETSSVEQPINIKETDENTVTDEEDTNSESDTITPPEESEDDDSKDSDSKDNGSSHRSAGSRGVGGSSPEPAKNIEVKELSQVFIENSNNVEINFRKNATCVMSVNFDAKKTAGKTTTIVEMLKGKSSLVSEMPTDAVYRYFNIWIGNRGFTTPENIENAVICFKVEKSWLQENDIDESSIILNRYNDGKWDKAPVSLLKQDDKFLYFTAETPGFSSFAITGKMRSVSEENSKNIQPESEPEMLNEKGIGNKGMGAEQEAEQEESTSAPGFEIVYCMTCLLALYLYKRK